MNTQRTELQSVRDRHLLLGLALLVTLMQSMSFVRGYWGETLEGMEPDLWMHSRDRLVAWLYNLAFVYFIVRTTRYFLTRNMRWTKLIGIQLGIAVLTALIWYTLFFFSMHPGCIVGDCEKNMDQIAFWAFYNFQRLFTIYLLTASLTYAYYYINLYSRDRVRRSRMENQLLETRLSMLRSQLQPHFLFNALNSISSLVEINTRKAQDMIANLGELLRRVLDQGGRQLISLEEELELLQCYLDIELTRFAEDLRITKEIDPRALQAQVPAMLLQPLVENSIRHGFSSRHLKLDIHLTVQKKGDRLVIHLKDNGKGIQHNGRSVFECGTGLSNTRERLETIYGRKFQFFVENAGQGVQNILILPYRNEASPPATHMTKAEKNPA